MTIQLNSKGEDVKQIQTALNLYPDGIFGPNTKEAVVAFQRENGLKPDGIVGPETLKVLQARTNMRASKRKVKEIIVHCSATKAGAEFTVEDIRRWHKQQGWSDVGYHYVVYLDGSIHAGRSVDVAGAHCTGHNTGSIGICYIGGLDAAGKHAKDSRTDKQKASLLALLQRLRKMYPEATIHGHRDFARKDCPSFNATLEYANI